jgi:hypothetical protein
MSTQEMQQAMNTLSAFSEKEHRYFQYQARQEYLRQQRTMQLESEEAKQREAVALREKDIALQEKDTALQEKDTALQEKEAAQQREQAALAEIERLKALLNQ